MAYQRKDGDKSYRKINLRQWDELDRWGEFTDPREVITDHSAYIVIEVEHGDGSKEIIPDEFDGNRQEVVGYQIQQDGKIIINFNGPRSKVEGPCMGHLFLYYKNQQGIRYHFPRITTPGTTSYSAQIGNNINSQDIEIRGDQYFDSVFICRRQL